jgi:hypothetical protein
MRLNLLACVIACAPLLSSCQTFKQALADDQGAPEGVVHDLGKSFFPAETSAQELYRAEVVFAILTQAAEASLKDPSEISAFNEYMGPVDQNIRYARDALEHDCSALTANLTVTGCAGTFESQMTHVELALMPLAKAALPVKEADTIEQDLVGGNLLKTLLDTLKFSASIVGAVHAGDSAYRSAYLVLALDDPAGKITPAKITEGNTTLSNYGTTVPRDAINKGLLEKTETFTFADFRAMYLILNDSCRRMKERVPTSTKVTCGFSFDLAATSTHTDQSQSDQKANIPPASSAPASSAVATG